MPLKTKVQSVNFLKRLFSETLLNSTTAITKISDESVVNALAFGVGKVAQKALKDIAIVESHLYAEFAYGANLDTIATRQGVPARFGALESGTYMRIVADAGTLYTAGTHNFSGDRGIIFELTTDFTVNSQGFGYAKVRSTVSGSRTNIDSLGISTMTLQPTGHIAAFNEYESKGGRDSETDDEFRTRIMNYTNILANSTLAGLTAVAQSFDQRVLEMGSRGLNASGNVVLTVTTVNGIDLLAGELTTLLSNITPYLSLSDYNPLNTNSVNVVLENITYAPVDISFRVQLVSGANADLVRRELQIEISKYLDWRFWKNRYSNKVEWDDLLEIVKSNINVRYVPDSFFVPSQDQKIALGNLPRVRSFTMLDVDGTLIVDDGGVLDPSFYPNGYDLSLNNFYV